MGDDVFGGDATHAFDQPTAQILLNARNGGRFSFPILRDLKLRPKFGMVFPGAVQFQSLPCLDVGKVACDGDEFTGAGCFKPSDGIARFFRMIGEPLDHALQGLHGRSLIAS